MQLDYFPPAFVCGRAAHCRRGSKQNVTVTVNCPFFYVFVHELGHALCLQHEFRRLDRDEYLHFKDCDGKPQEKINSVTTRGHIFDYGSTMMYECRRCFGKPTMDGVTQCFTRKGLSPIDADKLNTYYNCKGKVFINKIFIFFILFQGRQYYCRNVFS